MTNYPIIKFLFQRKTILLPYPFIIKFLFQGILKLFLFPFFFLFMFYLIPAFSGIKFLLYSKLIFSYLIIYSLFISIIKFLFQCPSLFVYIFYLVFLFLYRDLCIFPLYSCFILCIHFLVIIFLFSCKKELTSWNKNFIMELTENK